MLEQKAVEEQLSELNGGELEAVANAIYGVDGYVIDHLYAFDMNNLDDVASPGTSVLELLRKFEGFNPREDMFRYTSVDEYESLSHSTYIADLHDGIDELAEFIIDNADNVSFTAALPASLRDFIDENN